MTNDWPNKNRKMTWHEFDELLTDKMIKMGIWKRHSMSEIISEDSFMHVRVSKAVRDEYEFEYRDRLHHAEMTAEAPFTPSTADL